MLKQKKYQINLYACYECIIVPDTLLSLCGYVKVFGLLMVQLTVMCDSAHLSNITFNGVTLLLSLVV